MSLFTCIFYVLSPRTVYIKLSNFIPFSLESDDMESSKRCVKLFSLVFILNSNSSAYNSHNVFFADESLCHAE